MQNNNYTIVMISYFLPKKKCKEKKEKQNIKKK